MKEKIDYRFPYTAPNGDVYDWVKRGDTMMIEIVKTGKLGDKIKKDE